MRLALGTIDLTDDERAAISAYYGERANRDTCRRYIISNGRESLVDQMLSMSEADWMQWSPLPRNPQRGTV